MFIRDKKGRIIAELRFAAGENGDANRTDKTKPAQSPLFRTLKVLPREILKVDVRYIGLGFEEFVPLTQYQGYLMDIQAALADHEDAQLSNSKETKEASKMLFVAPISENTPDDGVLLYSTVESLFDLAAIPDRTVVLFRPDQTPMIKCLCDNPTLFDIELRALTGIPETDYSTEFDSVTWSLDRVAYLPFLSELRLASEIGAQLEVETQTDYDREKAVYTRKTGLVKEHKGFLLPSEGEDNPADDSEVG